MDIADLAIELAAGHPVTGAYNVDNVIAAGELNAKNRDGDADIAALFFMMLMEETYKLDQGDDTQDRSLWLRIKDVAAMTFTTTGSELDPWGSGETVTEIQWIKCKQLYEFFVLAIQGSLPLALTDTNFKSYLAGAQGAGCMSEAQETALIALSENRQSRAEELGFGWVRAGNVQEARG